LIASISMAGILYLSYRQISRGLFLSFVLIAYFLFLIWRGVARLGFRMRKDWPDIPRSVLIIGAGPLGKRIEEQIQRSQIKNIQCVGFIDDELGIKVRLQRFWGNSMIFRQ
jgi:FlaA1/EpsC-like NDP-sugar epimerase